MQNLTENEQTIVLHIHEHLGPFRDRLSKVEAIVGTHANALEDITENFQKLERKVDANHLENVRSISDLKENMSKEFKQHRDQDTLFFGQLNNKIDENNKLLNEKIVVNGEEYKKLKWMILGASSIVSIIISIIVVFLEVKDHIF